MDLDLAEEVVLVTGGSGVAPQRRRARRSARGRDLYFTSPMRLAVAM